MIKKFTFFSFCFLRLTNSQLFLRKGSRTQQVYKQKYVNASMNKSCPTMILKSLDILKNQHTKSIGTKPICNILYIFTRKAMQAFSPIGVKAMQAFSSKIKKNIYISDNSAQQ
jgi:hypothetical protein